VLFRSNIELAGLHLHIGSQILSPKPFATAFKKVSGLCRELKAQYPTFRYLDIGGGIGVQYRPDQAPLSPETFAAHVLPVLRKLDLSVILEPGRFLVANAGLLLCRVQYVKDGPSKKFVVVDAGMNDLIRPSLYEAYHVIEPVQPRAGRRINADIVGPICESGDFIALERALPPVRQDDLIAVRSAGAYGFSMSSNYNSRPRAAEIIVEGRRALVARKRETLQDLVRGE
jgi:diaminopimelate decarboxylase